MGRNGFCTLQEASRKLELSLTFSLGVSSVAGASDARAVPRPQARVLLTENRGGGGGSAGGPGKELLLTHFICRKRRKSRKENQAMRKAPRAQMMKKTGWQRSGSSAGSCSRRKSGSGRSNAGRTSRPSSNPSFTRSKQAKNSEASKIPPQSRS